MITKQFKFRKIEDPTKTIVVEYIQTIDGKVVVEPVDKVLEREHLEMKAELAMGI